MISYTILVLVSFTTLVLGFEAGKSVGYEEAKSVMVTLITTIMKMNEKETKNE